MQAIQSGKFKDVAHMRGGIYSWYKKGLTIDGNYDGTFAGRTPSVVEEKVPTHTGTCSAPRFHNAGVSDTVNEMGCRGSCMQVWRNQLFLLSGIGV